MKFKIQNVPVSDLFSYETIELTTGFYTVIGANGTGKSSLLRALQQHANNQKDMAVAYLDVYNVIKNASNLELPGNSDVSHVQGYMLDSNGEFILRKFGNFCEELDEITNSLGVNPQQKKVIAIIDGLDDGANIPMIIFFKNVLAEHFDKIRKMVNECVFILSANQYETTIGTRVLDVHTGTKLEITSYEAFKTQVLASYQQYVARLTKEDKTSNTN